MKKLLRNWKVMIVALVIMSAMNINEASAQGSVSLQVFYDELDPYGTWMDYGNYGYVWVPRVDAGFTPYQTNGYWINTEYGNTWVSDYAWGWAPFHYGRWFFDDYYGWMWVPDTEWAPAWVAWRSGGGYYGWAPLMPGLGISASFNYYNGIPDTYWSFVPYQYVTYRNVYAHCLPRPRVINVIHHTTIVTHNHRYNSRNRFFTGPSRRDIERSTHSRVEVYKVNSRNKPGRSEVDRGSVSFYKPDIDRSRESKTGSAPSRVVRSDRRSTNAQPESRREQTREQERRPVNTQRTQVERSNDSNAPSIIEREKVGRENQRKEVEKLQQKQNADREDNNRSEQVIQRERENAALKRQPTVAPAEQKPVERKENAVDPSRLQRERSNDNRDVQRRSPEQIQRPQQNERQQSVRPKPEVQRERAPERNSVIRPQPQVQRAPAQQRTAPANKSNNGSKERRHQ